MSRPYKTPITDKTRELLQSNNIDSSTARKQWTNQKFQSKLRGIKMLLTFEEWVEWWVDTGHYHDRGIKIGQYVMSRFGDKGDYTLDNIFCQTTENNLRESQIINDNLVIRTNKSCITLYKRNGCDIWQYRYSITNKPLIRLSTGTTDFNEAKSIALNALGKC